MKYLVGGSIIYNSRIYIYIYIHILITTIMLIIVVMKITNNKKK